LNTWAKNENEYEVNQWTLTHEMRGSLLVFLLLTVTAPATPHWRRTILILTALYFYNSGEFIGPFCFFCGALLSDLSLVLRARSQQGLGTHRFDSERAGILHQHWPLALAFLAFFLGTMPPENQRYTAWSRIVFDFFENYVTATGGIIDQFTSHADMAGSTDRVIGAFAGIFLLVATLHSQPMRTFLSTKQFVFLGGISFPLYLLHGTFIRIPLQWCVIRLLPRVDPQALHMFFAEDQNNAYLVCDSFSCRLAATVIYVLWLGALVIAALLWKRYVDVHGITFSRWAENVVSGKQKVVLKLPDWPRLGGLSGFATARISIGRVDTEKLQ
jgi:peptidoglycan/LPS O-acetylase OafA/YrhL